MNQEDIENLYERKFGESMPFFSTRCKQSSDLEDCVSKIKREEIEKDGYILIRPQRKLSLFDKKCKYCDIIPNKTEDKECYLKYSCCSICYILNEEGRNGKK